MTQAQIRYDDGAAYDRMMGVWSRIVGEVFLEWLAAPPGLRWIDVGCGSGALTELIVERCAPTEVHGIDPSEAQLSFARARPIGRSAKFGLGDALALPYGADNFDAAVMGLVIFFIPEPAKGIAEIKRVVRPGGIVATYVWDLIGGGHPLELMRSEMQAMGIAVPNPPRVDASAAEALHGLWAARGLEALEMREIPVHRTFADFEEFWSISVGAPSVSSAIAAMAPSDVELLKQRTRGRILSDTSGRITQSARANAIKGLVSK